MSSDCEALTAHLIDALRTSVNADGGWGYFPGKTSRLEPTCWAALALLGSTTATTGHELPHAAIARIARWQGADGLLSDTPGAPSNIAFNGLAMVVIHHALESYGRDESPSPSIAEKLLSAVVDTKGTTVWLNNINRQNNRLVGWPWNTGTFSWIEPTSWCLLGLKIATNPQPPAAVAARMEEAERVLVDRCCHLGGWNAGNSNMLGKELPPYVPTTALALLALQDRAGGSEVTRSIGWLTRNWSREVSGLSSSLTIVAMGVYGLQVEALRQLLCNRVSQNGIPENVTTAAMVLYALTGTRHKYGAFRL